MSPSAAVFARCFRHASCKHPDTHSGKQCAKYCLARRYSFSQLGEYAMRRFTPTIVAASLVTVIVAAITLAAPPQADAQTDDCRDVSVPVAVVGQHLDMHGPLCQPTGAAKPVVQVLVPRA